MERFANSIGIQPARLPVGLRVVAQAERLLKANQNGFVYNAGALSWERSRGDTARWRAKALVYRLSPLGTIDIKHRPPRESAHFGQRHLGLMNGEDTSRKSPAW